MTEGQINTGMCYTYIGSGGEPNYTIGRRYRVVEIGSWYADVNEKGVYVNNDLSIGTQDVDMCCFYDTKSFMSSFEL